MAGKTVIEIQRELTTRIRHAIKDPQVSVRVARFHGRRVEIAGEVKSPQTLYLDNIPLRISDALVKTGGFSQASNPAEVTLIRGGKATVLNLMSYYEEGDLEAELAAPRRRRRSTWEACRSARCSSSER